MAAPATMQPTYGQLLQSNPPKSARVGVKLLKKIPGNDLLSHLAAVPSAQEGLTSVFGMGTGGSPPLWSPGKNLFFFYYHKGLLINMVKPHGKLVLVG